MAPWMLRLLRCLSNKVVRFLAHSEVASLLHLADITKLLRKHFRRTTPCKNPIASMKEVGAVAPRPDSRIRSCDCARLRAAATESCGDGARRNHVAIALDSFVDLLFFFLQRTKDLTPPGTGTTHMRSSSTRVSTSRLGITKLSGTGATMPGCMMMAKSPKKLHPLTSVTFFVWYMPKHEFSEGGHLLLCICTALLLIAYSGFPVCLTLSHLS